MQDETPKADLSPDTAQETGAGSVGSDCYKDNTSEESAPRKVGNPEPEPDYTASIRGLHERVSALESLLRTVITPPDFAVSELRDPRHLPLTFSSFDDDLGHPGGDGHPPLNRAEKKRRAEARKRRDLLKRTFLPPDQLLYAFGYLKNAALNSDGIWAQPNRQHEGWVVATDTITALREYSRLVSTIRASAINGIADWDLVNVFSHLKNAWLITQRKRVEKSKGHKAWAGNELQKGRKSIVVDEVVRFCDSIRHWAGFNFNGGQEWDLMVREYRENWTWEDSLSLSLTGSANTPGLTGRMTDDEFIKAQVECYTQVAGAGVAAGLTGNALVVSGVMLIEMARQETCRISVEESFRRSVETAKNVLPSDRDRWERERFERLDRINHELEKFDLFNRTA